MADTITFILDTNLKADKKVHTEVELLSEHGYKVVIVTKGAQDQSDTVSTEEHLNNTQYKVHSVKAENRLDFFLRAALQAWREKTTFYHAHSVSLTLLARLIALFAKRRFISDYHELILTQRGNGALSPASVYYEQEDLWNRPLDEVNRKRVEAVSNLIPEDAYTVLDCGCGGGMITNYLAKRGTYAITGMDISEEAITHVNAETIVGDIARMPFPDRAFDLVLATEVLEHLPTDVLSKAAAELGRVADKYILVGVPNKENLAIGLSRCYACGSTFHVNHHYHSFSKQRLKTLFDRSWRLQVFDVGGGQGYYYNWFLLWVKRRFGGYWARTETAVCDKCGSQQGLQGIAESNRIRYLCDKKNNDLRDRPRNKFKSHVLALYSRE